VESETDRGTFDPELDLLPIRPTRRSREPLEPYQRLIANPFLAVLSCVVVFAVVRFALERRDLTGFLFGISLLFLSFLLVQFHCLDCGKTGWLLRYRHHACPAVVARWQNQIMPRIHGPRVKIQVVVWLLLLASAFVLVKLVFGA
jgi:hypothetical protein